MARVSKIEIFYFLNYIISAVQRKILATLLLQSVECVAELRNASANQVTKELELSSSLVCRYALVFGIQFLVNTSYILVLKFNIKVKICENYNPCSKFATCTEKDGSATCTCNAGYRGNGTYCSGVCLLFLRFLEIITAQIYQLSCQI